MLHFFIHRIELHLGSIVADFHSVCACILTVFCEACQDRPGLYAKVSEMLPIKVASYMLLPYTLPVQSAYSVAQR